MSKDKQDNDAFGVLDFGWRLLLALVLVLITYNPTDYSFVHWLRTSMATHTLGPAHAVAGVALLAGWLVVVGATRAALGSVGLIVLCAFLATLVWWFIDLGWLVANSRGSIEWVVLVCLAVFLAVGMSWAHIWRRITGQVAVERVHD